MTKRAGYGETIRQLLAEYRFLAYGLAVILIQVIPLSQGVTLALHTLVILVLVGVYTPLRWREAGSMRMATLTRKTPPRVRVDELNKPFPLFRSVLMFRASRVPLG